jgi:Tol biopolymer transport system component
MMWDGGCRICQSWPMGRLLLVDPGGRVELCDVDSGQREPLSRPGADPAQRPSGTPTPARTAAWSPSGQWVACALDAVELDGAHDVAVHHVGSDRAEIVAAETTAFYLCPSPGGRYLGHLSPGPLGLEFGLSDVETGELRVIERGQPLFWSWSPDAAHLAVHMDDTVTVVPLDGGESRVLTGEAGAFLAPWWMPDGSVVVAAGDRLVRYWLDGSVTEVASAPSGRYALDPEGQRLAFVAMVDDAPALVVLDLLTGQRDVVLAERTAGFFWSPEGRRLAALVVAGAGQVQWLVHDGEATVRLAPFRPGTSWAREVLPFFEQYSQSHAVWSSDGTQLVAPGLDADGSTEAVVQTVSEPSTTTRVPGARLAWWAEG